MTLYKWSQTAVADATADSTINWAEGQAPSSINDSARAMMAATAKYRDDIAGAIVSGGTSTAYTVSSYEVFDTFAHLGGQMIAFTPHITNAATVTLNVDSLGARPLRTAPNTELLAGTIIQGTPYVAVYNNADGVFYLQGFYGNPYNIPLGAGLDYWGTTTPNSCFAFPQGNVISTVTYAALYALIGTTYNVGNEGAGMFRIPDKRGRVSAMLDNSGAILNSATLLPSGNTLGAIGGAQQHQLALSEMPSHNHSASVNDPGHNHSTSNPDPGGGNSYQAGTQQSSVLLPGPQTGTSQTGISVSIGNQGGSASFSMLQPTIGCNYIMRII